MTAFIRRQGRLTRRSFLYGAAAAGGLMSAAALPSRAWSQAAAIVTAESARVRIPYGVQVGDMVRDRAILWSRADRPARLIVDYATTESLRNARRVVGPAALPDSDYTARIDLTGLPPGQRIFYRVRFQDLSDSDLVSEPATGSFRTAPAAAGNIRFVWSGDTAGQGWGINPDFGGMKIYETMRRAEPHFFIHSGDTIYADGPIPAEKELADGGRWKNLTTEAKSKVAETLDEFRGNYAYNLMDENLRRFNAEVPMYAQWDDHEVINNWYPQERLDDGPEYKVKSVNLLAARGRRAFLEYMPIRLTPEQPERLYRHFGHGPLLDVFRLDMRSYRGPNSANDQTAPGPDTAFLGAEQIGWLKRGLLGSQATWKVVAADMPIGLIVPDGDAAYENVANGNGPARGRELEIAGLLRFIRDNGIRNVVWLTADVHYTAAHFYDPSKARFQDFAPFWEFVSGPLNAGTFGPNPLDDTFGPQVMFVAAPPEGQANLPPSAGMQFFGQVDIDGESGIMTVALKNIDGDMLYSKALTPERQSDG